MLYIVRVGIYCTVAYRFKTKVHQVTYRTTNKTSYLKFVMLTYATISNVVSLDDADVRVVIWVDDRIVV